MVNIFAEPGDVPREAPRNILTIVETPQWTERDRQAWRAIRPDQALLIRRIREQWGDTLQKNLAVGRALSELNLPKSAWRLNLHGMPMSYSWARRLIKISNDGRIQTHQGRMPDARDTLHEITLLSQREFQKALALGVITPASTRQDIRDFRRSELGVDLQLCLKVVFECSAKDRGEAIDQLYRALSDIKDLLQQLHPNVRIKRWAKKPR